MRIIKGMRASKLVAAFIIYIGCLPGLARGLDAQSAAETWSLNRTSLQFAGLYYWSSVRSLR